MKNTSVKPSTIFDFMPRPNQTAKIGARITRGIELTAMIYGSSSRDANGVSASHKPTTNPAAVPIANAASVSNKVTARCSKILPDTNQSISRCTTSSGSPKKNGDSTSARVSPYHARNNAASNARCHGHIARRWSAASSASAFSSGMRHHHLLLEGMPDFRVQRHEARIEANLGHVARPRQIDRELGHRAGARSRRQDDDAVGE